MTIIFFSGNRHKAREVEAIFTDAKVRIYTDFMDAFEVVEYGKSFAENAKIKLNALKGAFESQIDSNEKLRKIKGEKIVLMAEDSGICVESLDNLPNIFSARFANLPPLPLKNGESLEAIHSADSSDKDNIARLISELQARSLSESKARFVSCVACYKVANCTQGNARFLTAHGFLDGKVICEVRGDNGFGYDPIFMPNGSQKTLGELSSEIKNTLSHRKNALDLMRLLLK